MSATDNELMFEILNLVCGLNAQKQQTDHFQESLYALYLEHEFEIESGAQYLSVLTSGWITQNGEPCYNEEQHLIILADLQFHKNKLAYPCPINSSDIIYTDIDTFCSLQEELKHKEAEPYLYIMNGVIEAHTKIQNRSDQLTLSDAHRLLDELDVERDCDGNYSHSALRQLVDNENLNTVLDQRAAAFKILCLA